MKRLVFLVVALSLVLNILPVNVVLASGDGAEDAVEIVGESETELDEVEPVKKLEEELDAEEPVDEKNTEELGEDEVIEDDEPVSRKSKLLISEFQLRGRGANDGSFVEIYNNSDEVFIEDGYRLEYVVSNETGFGTVVLLTELDFGDLEFLPQGYMVVGGLETDDFAMGRIGNEARGYIRIMFGEEVVDLAGYGKSPLAEGGFPIKAPQRGWSAQRCEGADGLILDTNVNMDDFLVGSEYPVTAGFGMVCAEEEPPVEINYCTGLRLSEVGANLDGQFIEVWNSTGEVLDISECKLKTNRNKNEYIFSDLELEAGGYLAVMVGESGLTLTKTTDGTVTLLNSVNEKIDETGYANLKSGTSWALINEVWQQTYAVTLEEANVWMEFLPCTVGYERNSETGRCRKITAEDPLPDCGPGKFRNPETGRCKSYETLTSVLAPCREGYYRNPETNRCRKIATAATAELVPCPEGYERNPETNRCRKIRINNGADYPVASAVSGEANFVGWWALAVVIGGGLVYVGWQFRWEIRKIFRRKSGVEDGKK